MAAGTAGTACGGGIALPAAIELRPHALGLLALQLLSVAPNHYSRFMQLSAGRVQSTILQRTTVRLRYSTCTDGSRTPACVQPGASPASASH